MPSTQGRGRLEPRSGRAAGASRTSRTALQRVLIGVNVVVIALVLLGASASAYGWYRFQQIETVSIPTPTTIDAAGNSREVEEEEPVVPGDPGPPRNYLLVGSDTRKGQDPESFGTIDDSDAVNADAILVVRVDPRNQRVDVVSFLRDLWLPIYDRHGEPVGSQRINTALEDGQNGLIQTIGRNFGIPIHHYAKVDFEGFQELVDAIGGIEVPLTHSVRDWDPEKRRNRSGLDIQIDEPSCVTLDGEMALAYVRSRYYQERRDGGWQRDFTSDHGRTARQRDVIQRAISQAIAEGRTSPRAVNQLFGIAVEHLTVSKRLKSSPSRIVAIANAFRGAPPDAVRQHELDTVDARRGRAQVLELLENPHNTAVLDIFRGVPPVDQVEAEARPLGPPAPAPPPPEAVPTTLTDEAHALLC